MDLRSLILTQDRILLDGAMGTQLAVRGCTPGAQSNTTSPGVVLAIHREHAASGAQILTTNTITANRVLAEAHHLDIDVRCAGGTYIRSLARDIGAALGAGGYCASLVRTEVGPFTLADADDLGDAAEKIVKAVKEAA